MVYYHTLLSDYEGHWQPSRHIVRKPIGGPEEPLFYESWPCLKLTTKSGALVADSTAALRPTARPKPIEILGNSSIQVPVFGFAVLLHQTWTTQIKWIAVIVYLDALKYRACTKLSLPLLTFLVCCEILTVFIPCCLTSGRNTKFALDRQGTLGFPTTYFIPASIPRLVSVPTSSDLSPPPNLHILIPPTDTSNLCRWKLRLLLLYIIFVPFTTSSIAIILIFGYYLQIFETLVSPEPSCQIAI